jgi:hypothetical protein
MAAANLHPTDEGAQPKGSIFKRVQNVRNRRKSTKNRLRTEKSTSNRKKCIRYIINVINFILVLKFHRCERSEPLFRLNFFFNFPVHLKGDSLAIGMAALMKQAVGRRMR